MMDDAPPSSFNMSLGPALAAGGAHSLSTASHHQVTSGGAAPSTQYTDTGITAHSFN